MDDVDLDELLRRCASEAIHNPGAVQPHGALLVLDHEHTVVAASANLGDITGTDLADALGRPVADGFAPRWRHAFEQAQLTDRATVEEPDGRRTCTSQRAGELTFLEIERDPDDQRAHAAQLQQTMEQIMGASAPLDLAQRLVGTIADLTGFDRVMCYRFDEDWHGEVIAEKTLPGVESFDGLRFPASDIPPQARAQYEHTPLRLIPDSHAEPVPLIAVGSLDPADLDLSDARLRAVSPIHLRYLQNLGVRSSMSVSLTVAGRLWGIVACHHVSGPLRPSVTARTVIELAARTASMLLTVLESGRATQRRLDLLHRLDQLTSGLVRADDQTPIEALAEQGSALLDLVEAGGAVLRSGPWATTIGEVAPPEITQRLIEESRSQAAASATDGLRLIEPAWDELPGGAAGALTVTFGATAEGSITWYRPEVIETVRWAGDPTAKPIDQDAAGAARLGPRTSFATYAEVVRGRSAPWTPHEVEIAEELAARLTDAEILQAQRDARLAAQLQQTLLLESFPEIRGVAGAAEYRPVSNSPLGGDWYDVFYLPSGRSIVAVGDVAGHGLEVAAVMAQLRHALRAYLVRAPSIDVALVRLNHLTRTLLPAEMATLVLAELDLADGVVRFANAGHPPPLVIGRDGVRLVGQRGMALGILSPAEYRLAEEPVRPGERLVLYSDGLIERRTSTLDQRIALLAEEAAATASLSLQEQATALVERLTEGSDVDDDVTVVVVEILEDGAIAGPAAR